MTAPRCDRCNTELPTGYTTVRITAIHQELHMGPDGTGMAAMLAAMSACSWSCLTVLAAQRAMAEGDPDAVVQMVAERERQVSTEQWEPEHDDQHPDGQLAAAAACYVLPHAAGFPENPGDDLSVAWPWEHHSWKPKNMRRDLLRAGALLAAEVDRDHRRNNPVRF